MSNNSEKLVKDIRRRTRKKYSRIESKPPKRTFGM